MYAGPIPRRWAIQPARPWHRLPNSSVRVVAVTVTIAITAVATITTVTAIAAAATVRDGHLHGAVGRVAREITDSDVDGVDAAGAASRTLRPNHRPVRPG